MSDPFVPSDISHYEQACDQAIAMCNGNMRSTIKALIMANEYLEVELLELQAALEAGVVEKLSADGIAREFSSDMRAGSREESASKQTVSTRGNAA